MDIPVILVPSVDTTQWPNEIFVGYATGWMRRYDQEFAPDFPAPQKLQPYLADAKTLVQTLLADYKEATAAPQTELIDQADKQRDALLAQVSTMIEAMLKMAGMPQKQMAAQKLKTGWDIYKPTAKAALRDESTQIQQWLEYVHARAVQGAALADLGLTQIVADLEQQNNEVIRLMDERAAERQQQKTIVLADDRRPDRVATALRGQQAGQQARLGEERRGGQPPLPDRPRLDMGAAHRGRQGPARHRPRRPRPHRFDGQEGREGRRVAARPEGRAGEADGRRGRGEGVPADSCRRLAGWRRLAGRRRRGDARHAGVRPFLISIIIIGKQGAYSLCLPIVFCHPWASLL